MPVCTTDRGCLFGQVAEGEMILNDAGLMVDQIWADIPLHYPGIGVDTVQMMPNHIHGVVVIDPYAGIIPVRRDGTVQIPDDHTVHHGGPQCRLGTVSGSFVATQ